MAQVKEETSQTGTFVRTAQLALADRKVRIILVVLALILAAWFALGYYLHLQVVQSRAKVEQNRIEANRRQEFKRRGAQYRQELQQRRQPARTRSIFDS